MQNLTQKVKRRDIAGNAEEEESDYTYSTNLLVFLSQELDTAQREMVTIHIQQKHQR